MPGRRLLLAACLCTTLICAAQTPGPPPQTPGPPTPPPGSIQDRIRRIVDTSSGAWTPAQIANMARLRDAALQDSYALDQLHHLTDNIGPRLAGSPQAQ